RQVPPELVFLAEQKRELPAITILPLPGNKTQHSGRAAGRIKQARQHFQGGGFAGPVGAQKTNQFAGLNREADIADREGLLVPAPHQALDRATKTRLLLVSAKGLREVADFDGGHERVISLKCEKLKT